MVTVLNADVEPISEHSGTVKSWFMYMKEELRDQTAGSYLEFVNEFALDAGVSIEPHFHDSHEFYYVIAGDGLMAVGEGTRQVHVGDLVHIEPNAPHSILAGPSGVRCFCFAVSFQAPGVTYTVTEIPNWPPSVVS
jgi:quercetin dioxygenase-like cupin family protein